MTRNYLCLLGIVLSAGMVVAESRWVGALERLPYSGTAIEHPLSHPRSQPTTIALAPDGTPWFTQGAGNRMGRITRDGRIAEFSRRAGSSVA